MKLLVLGGTIFVGRHFVEAALAAGHEVTLLHRGMRGADLFPTVDRILVDRDGPLSELDGRRWDAVVDCCGYVPRVVRKSSEALADKADRYLFVSTISVYRDMAASALDESAAVGVLDDPSVEKVDGETYGPLKALCEQEVCRVFEDRALIVRPGLIAGPYDPTNRFTYWVDRFVRGGDVLIPARREQPLQLIDARDLGVWMLRAVTEGRSGTYNAAGPAKPRTFGDMIDVCHALNSEAEIVEATEAELEKHDIKLWQELPLALAAEPPSDGLLQIDNRKAIKAGLQFRDWSETARDVLAWTPKPSSAFGLDPAKESTAVQALRTDTVHFAE